ncbi:hypothetical protein NSQ30_10410 [Bacillus sp. FSL R7-0651]|uniref:hypothetical protein n=1 Tax=unclassified Bacillus (in: firmicutes) TaxID=185979 RepID=UPI0031585FB9
MEVIKNVELDGHKLLIQLEVDKLSIGWAVSKRLARDLKTNIIVYEQPKRSLPILNKTLKEITIETAQHAVERIAFKEKDTEELQELRNWDGVIN